MSFYFFVLFLHITGAMGIFVGMGLEWLIVHNFKRATTYSQALQWTDSFRLLPAIFSISSILILASGIYMWAETWGDDSMDNYRVLAVFIPGGFRLCNCRQKSAINSGGT